MSAVGDRQHRASMLRRLAHGVVAVTLAALLCQGLAAWHPWQVWPPQGGQRTPEPSAQTQAETAAAASRPIRPPAESPDRSRQRASSRILIYGDSISVGEIGDFGWRYFLDKHLDATARNADLVGRKTLPVRREYTRKDAPLQYADMDFDLDSGAFWGDSLSDPKHPIEPWITKFRPDVVVVVLGLNDMGWNMVTPQEALGVIGDMVHRVRSVNPDIDFVFSNITYTGYGRAPEFNAGLPGTLAALDTPASRVVMADSHAGWVSTMNWRVSDVADHKDPGHPNTRGEVKIAAAVSDALAKLRIGTKYPRPLVFPPQPPYVVPLVSYRMGPSWVEVAAIRPDGTNSFDVFRQLDDGTWQQVVVNWEIGWARVEGLDPCRTHRFKVRARKYHALADDAFASSPETISLPHSAGRCPD